MHARFQRLFSLIFAACCCLSLSVATNASEPNRRSLFLWEYNPKKLALDEENAKLDHVRDCVKGEFDELLKAIDLEDFSLSQEDEKSPQKSMPTTSQIHSTKNKSLLLVYPRKKTNPSSH